jgi:hypothetical protein
LNDILPYAGMGLFGLAALACLWGAVHGARRRKWKFTGVALLLLLVFSIGFIQAYGVSQGRRYAPDPDELRLR